MTKRVFMFFICSFLKNFFSPYSSAQSIDIVTGGWQFKTGDDPTWATPQLNDDDWQNIAVGASWESVLLKDGYDGFAWYRKTVTISKDLRRTINKNKGLVLKLGMIDDADETYFNGVKIGATGVMPPNYESAWDAPRKYIVPPALIRYNEPNVIAVRVYDKAGGGGLYGGEYVLEPSSWKDKFGIIINNAAADNAFTTDAAVRIKVSFVNNSDKRLSGIAQCEIKTFGGKTVAATAQKVDKLLRGRTTAIDDFVLDIKEKGFYITTIAFKDDKGFTKKERKGFAVDPEQMTSPPDRPEDFDDYWAKARSELDSITPDFKITPNAQYSTEKVAVFDVEMRSLGGVRVRGYYTRPRDKTGIPALLHLQGYSSVMEPWSLDTSVVAFFLNIRGHGNSRDDLNPGFPGYLLHGIERPETYIYRGAYMDCVRAIDFLCSREEVDKTRIAVEGGSQGGALSIATAALDKRVKLCMPDVPFLSDFRQYFDIANWPASEFKDYVRKKSANWDEVYRVLSYIDIKNLAPSISCPVTMSVGLYDDICPPAINFAAYNNIRSSDKSYFLFPQSGHSLPSSNYDLKMAWMRKHFNIIP